MADSFLKKFKNIIFGKKESKEVVNSLEDFNKLTESYNELLIQQVDFKKKRNLSIRDLLTKYRQKDGIPESTLNIELVDMNNTVVRKKGKGKSQKRMQWEKDFRKMNNQNRGIII